MFRGNLMKKTEINVIRNHRANFVSKTIKRFTYKLDQSNTTQLLNLLIPADFTLYSQLPRV